MKKNIDTISLLFKNFRLIDGGSATFRNFTPSTARGSEQKLCVSVANQMGKVL